MSVYFGKCNFDGKPIDPRELTDVLPSLAPQAPDGEKFICRGNFGALCGAFHITKESRLEVQPHVCESDFVLTWDGRLDNRAELIQEVVSALSRYSSDIEIVAGAWRRWGVCAFPRLKGDWAMTVWNFADQSLILAKDFLGSRPLYYSVAGNQVTWCTVLDIFVLLRNQPLQLEEEYLAGWLGAFPATHLTPYQGIHSVPPSSFVQIKEGQQKLCKYWDFDPAKTIRYSKDEEYEEHFRDVFAESVRRRLRSDSPILGELSGGMDSSSIVCVADTLFASGFAEAPRLDTISFYHNGEPNWNEQPFFTKVEEKRGRTGRHVDVSSQEYFASLRCDGELQATPTSGSNTTKAGREFAEHIAHHNYRALLSGIGGDEVTGGVPTPVTELADLLSVREFSRFAHQIKLWAVDKRTPWFFLLAEVISEFLPVSAGKSEEHKWAPNWLIPAFFHRYRDALWGYEKRLKVFGASPSFQANMATLEILRRQIGSLSPPRKPVYEKRYPYLDRDFLEFVFAIPREQLLRPGQRRSLMRRALSGIVPMEILNRRRKAFVSKAPLVDIVNHWARLAIFDERMVSDSLGIVDRKAFLRVLEAGKNGQEIPIVSLLRTIALEDWLNNLAARNVLRSAAGCLQGQCRNTFTSQDSSCSELDTVLGRE